MLSQPDILHIDGVPVNNDVALRGELSTEIYPVLSRLPGMGRVMIVVRGEGVTHERIGVIEGVTRDGEQVVCTGAAHDWRDDLRQVALLAVDRSGSMKGNVLPKLEAVDAHGGLLFSVVGLDGLESFDAALAEFSWTSRPPKDKEPWEQATLGDNDPGIGPLAAASKAGMEIEIEMQRPGVVQRWSGLVPNVNPAMGFINIIMPDFHLHIRGGTIVRWEFESHAGAGSRVRLAAIRADNTPAALALLGPRAAFQPL
jgi:putative heme degradation protein